MITVPRILFAVGASTLILFTLPATADENGAGRGIMAATDKQYAEECGACHFAYPPGLLPARSWEKLLSNLGDHFGENAELGADAVQSLTAYLTKNAADKVRNRLSARIAKSAAGSTPLRITELSYFKRAHSEVPQRLVKDNPEVKSFSKCQVCHTRAAQGSFSENEINIPGHGKWD
jgi:hypothetical protein